MPDLGKLRAAVVGTGFIGVVHVEAVRGLGVDVLGVVGSTPARARAKAAVTRLPDPHDGFEAMLGDWRLEPAAAVARSARDRRWVEVPA